MHDILTTLASTIADGTSGLQVAIVGGLFVLAGTIVTVYGQIRSGRGDSALMKLVSDAQDNYAQGQADNRHLAEENTRMRELLAAWGKDPDEDPDDVRRRRR